MSTKKFKTEVQQLLDLMIHSLYSNRDIFLRELIANGADAIDKARFESIKDHNLAEEWAVKLIPDKKKKILKIIDNGIGMSEEELVRDIGTIAKSGTQNFLKALEESKTEDAPELIGQFGVGFYSAFMVAEKVEILTKKINGDKAYRWESSGEEKYSINEAQKDESGTEITLHLKGDAETYLEDWKLREIVKKYSDFIEYPIQLSVTEKEESGAEKQKLETINSQKAIWLRDPSEVSDEEHKNFLGHLSAFGGDPLIKIHFSAEGASEFKALMYIPEKAPFDLFMSEEKKKGLHLYIKRVFITDEGAGLLPDYMRFVKGVVDSSDLPLNISREILQSNPEIVKIRKNLLRKILGELKKLLKNDREKYVKFFKEFGKVFKEGMHTDYGNREKLRDLLIFESMNGKVEEYITLKDYCSAMPSDQKEIFYVTGENRKILENSPQLEVFRKKGFDVLFMTDPIDEWVVQSLNEYEGKKLKAVEKGDIAFDDDRKKAEKAAKEYKKLLDYLKKHLENKVKDVRFSTRLSDSACCLVGDEMDPSANMQRILKAMNQDAPETKRILELNSEHPIVKSMSELHKSSPRDEKLADFADILFDQALIAEGEKIEDPQKFTQKFASLMVNDLKSS